MKRVGLALIVALSAGCGGKAAKLLPAPPAGWASNGKATEEVVAGAGVHAFAAYVPSDTAKGVQKIEVHYAVRQSGGSVTDSPPSTDGPVSTEAESTASFMPTFWGPLRPEAGASRQLLELRMIAGHKALDGAYATGKHLVIIPVAPDVVVDLIAYGSGSPFDTNAPTALASFVEKIDYEHVKMLRP